MRDDLIRIIKILGVNYSEVFIDIELDSLTINSIEIEKGSIVLHTFVSDMDIEFLFDDLNQEDQQIIYQNLRSFLYN